VAQDMTIHEADVVVVGVVAPSGKLLAMREADEWALVDAFSEQAAASAAARFP